MNFLQKILENQEFKTTFIFYIELFQIDTKIFNRSYDFLFSMSFFIKKLVEFRLQLTKEY